MSSQYIEYWYMALNHKIGLKLRSSSPDRLLAKLYASRKASLDPALDKLSIVRPVADQLWIVHREPEKDSETDS